MMTIIELIDVFNKIKNTSSRNDKINIIKKYKDDDEFKDNLVFLLDNNLITGISSTKLKKNIGAVKTVDIPDVETEAKFWDALKKWLIEHSTGTHREILFCQKFLKSVPEERREFYEQMITKKLRLGCDYKTTNEAIPNLIWTYETQQAYPISDKNKPKKGEWFSLSEKLNGVNGGFLDGKCLSRQGKEICGMQHIIDELMAVGIDTHLYYVNGELIRDNVDNIPDEENFRLSTSIINSDAKSKPEISLIFYEVIPIKQFYYGRSNTCYKDRLELYKSIQRSIDDLGFKHIRLVDHYYSGTDQSEIQKWLDYADNHNKEGIMLNKNTPWQNKRNNGILKVKTFHTCDLRCTGVEEGDGKNTGTLGRINCDYKGNNLGVGSGFTDDQRNYYWNHQDEIVGKIVTVKYKTETSNADGTVSLQFPVFVTVRKDKDEVSYED